MAVTLTVQTLAARLRLTDGTAPPPEPQNSILTDMLGAASEIVTAYAPAAPDSIHNVAAGAIAGYLFEAPVGDGARFANALSNSGAEALLYRWKSQRVAIVGDGAVVIDLPTTPDGELTEAGANAAVTGIATRWRQTGIAMPAGDFYIELAYSGVWQMQQRVNRSRLADIAAVNVGTSSGGYMQLGDVEGQRFYISNDGTNIIVASAPGGATMGVRVIS